ncbi:MAG: WD40 repeat domain-containing protein, partial [Microcoleus sp.]
PYRGLLPFEEEHNKLFFGRNELIEKLQNIVKTNPLTVVLGASGSGKSSLVKAGLIPKLRKEKTEKWYFLPPIRPGKTPLQALNNALKQIQLPEVDPQDPQHNLVMSIDVWAKKHPNFKFLLFIDQSEEIITLCQDEDERKEFFQQILQAINAHRDKLRVVLSLRSDFEPQVRDAGLKFIPTGYNVGNTVLKGRWLNGRFIVRAMTRAELREAIEKPAETRVMYFQPHDLVEQLINEVADMPGALPLLSFALSELYLKYLKRQRDAQNGGITIDRALTQADYQELGGVILSLTQRADEEYQVLVQENPAYSHVIRDVMLRMVALGGGELARRQVPLSELEYPPDRNSLVKEVIEHFSTARLLVKGQDAEGNPYVEPAHDALVRGWEKLLRWKQENEESLLLQRRLTPAAEEWESQQQAEYLWNANPRLDLLKKELNSQDNWLNKLEAEFVRRSVGRKSFNTRRNWSIALGVMLGLGTGLVFSLIGERNALIGQIRATRLSAEANLPNQELNALLDSLRAQKYLKDWPGYLSLFKPESKLPFLKPDTELQPQVLQTLRKVFYVAKERNRIEVPQDLNKMFFTPDGTLLIATAGNDGIVRLQDLNGQKLSKVFSGHKGKVTLDVDRDGRLLATIDEQGTVRLWNSEGKQEEPPKFVASIPQSTYSHVYDRGLKFSPDGKQLVAYVNGGTKTGYAMTIYLWNLSESEPKLLKKSQDNFSSISFNSNNQLVVATQSNDTLGLSDFVSGKKLAEFKNFHLTLFGNLVFSPDGQHLAADFGADMSSAYFGSLDDKSWNDFTRISRASSIIFDASSHLIIGQEGDGIIDVYDPSSIKYSLSQALQFELKGHQGSIREVISSSNGRQVASRGNDHTIRLWKIENKPVVELSKIPNLISISISPDGKQLAVLESDGTVRLLDLNANELKRFVDFQGKISQIIFSPDGQQLAAVGKDSTIRLLDTNGKELYKSRNFEKTISQLIFRPDGKQLAVVENDGTIHLFNLNNKTWEILPDKVSPNDKLGETRRIIGFSSDGRLLVANSLPTDLFPQERGNIFLSELGAGIGKELVKFKGAGNTFNSIGLNTQGNLLA